MGVVVDIIIVLLASMRQYQITRKLRLDSVPYRQNRQTVHRLRQQELFESSTRQ
jgi:hypothetical protein